MIGLNELPLAALVVGLAAYTVLGGADFGVGFWQLAAGRGEQAGRIRDHAQHAIAAVWEANHVWLIFVLVVCWTAYPSAFASIASTLAGALFVAAIGIILRGTTYVLRTHAPNVAEHPLMGMFALSSILTPFALGAAAGGIASGRVPVGNAQGDLITSWINPTSIAAGVLAVLLGAFLAAVYLADDARRAASDLVEPLRRRALVMAVLAGIAAIAALVVVRDDARPIYDGLTSGWGLAAVALSAAAGVATIALVATYRFGLARISAAAAAAALVIGWPLAQRPVFLPGLTIDQAAAPRTTIVGLVLAIAAGAVILVPSLALLFRLVLRGTFDAEAPATAEPRRPQGDIRPPRRGGAVALTMGLVGTVVTVAFDQGLAIGLGLLLMAVAMVLAFVEITVTLTRP
jgi:cytochrome d ubiquinol oxidase subunit II